jgi:hypothetical protein
LYGAKPLGESEFRLVSILGMPMNSWKARQKNFEYLDTGKGFSNVAQQSSDVWNTWGVRLTDMKAKHHRVALDYLESKR